MMPVSGIERKLAIPIASDVSISMAGLAIRYRMIEPMANVMSRMVKMMIICIPSSVNPTEWVRKKTNYR